MADDLDNTIRENAQGPKRAAGDSGSVEQHSLTEQIEADKYLAGKHEPRQAVLGHREVIRHRPSGLTGEGLGMYLAMTSAIRGSVSASWTLSGL